jgi:tripartite-type tricarboxylate transporter receptor subunit TctC
MVTRRQALCGIGALAACPLAPGPAFAQSGYPNKPITLVVPFAAGGNTDVVARVIVEPMSQTLGQRLIIENVGGAGGTTGTLRATRAEPNGYTLLMGQMGTHAAAVGLYPKLGYRPEEDFEHIGQATDTPIVIIARKDFPASNLQEFIAAVKLKGDKATQAHGGVGSISHSTGLLFNSVAGLKSMMVSYRGSGPALNDLMSGVVDYMTDQIVHTAPHIVAGTVKGFGIATPKRSPVVPDLPTTIEGGLPAFQASGWNAMFAPKGTPAPIVAKLSAALNEALDDPITKQRLLDLGAELPEPANRGSAALKRFVGEEIRKWTPVLKGVQVE